MTNSSEWVFYGINMHASQIIITYIVGPNYCHISRGQWVNSQGWQDCPHCTWSLSSTGQCKKDVTPLLMHWSHVFLALTHQCLLMIIRSQGISKCTVELFSWNSLVSATEGLTHRGLNKVTAILQIKISNWFPWMKIFVFWLIFHWSLPRRIRLTSHH